MIQTTKVLLITMDNRGGPTGGREMLYKINQDSLFSIYQDNLIVYKLSVNKSKNFIEQIASLNGYIDGVSKKSINEIIELIKKYDVDKIFIDGSNLGVLVEKIKKKYKEIQIITFFHNVEARFFWGALKTKYSIRALAVLIANLIAEYKSVRLSDKRICLSERDSKILKKFYSKSASSISPIALVDQYKLDASELNVRFSSDNNYALFVGGNFYANREGIAWLVREVVPKINIKIYIVGNGMELVRPELEIPGKVEVIGRVDSLSEWYSNALFVVAPIFDGSGMKTKVAEALMYGKKIIGTSEAFSGYESFINEAGWICKTPEDFINAFDEAQNTIKLSYYSNLRDIYKEHYSSESAESRLREIIK